MEERELLRRIKNGDTAALEQAIERYSAYVASVIRGRSRSISTEDVEELTSDVFFALWQNAGRIQTGRLRPWLASVARNKTVEFLRLQKETLPLEENTVQSGEGLWEQLSRKEKNRAVRQAITMLSPLDQEIFFRYYDRGQTTREIAGAMDMPHSTVRSRLRRGRQALKTYLQNQGGICDETVY